MAKLTVHVEAPTDDDVEVILAGFLRMRDCIQAGHDVVVEVTTDPPSYMRKVPTPMPAPLRRRGKTGIVLDENAEGEPEGSPVHADV